MVARAFTRRATGQEPETQAEGGGACGGQGRMWLGPEHLRLNCQSTVVTVPTPRRDDLGGDSKRRGLREGDLGGWNNSDSDRGRFRYETRGLAITTDF